MAGEALKLRLFVWREFVPNRTLTFRRSGEADQQLLAAESGLQQEVYTWQTREDPFSGVSDEGIRLRLRELLVDRFEASRPPSERRISALAEFLSAVRTAIDGGQTEWTISEDPPVEDEDIPYRLNPLLALQTHLEWLVESFHGQPGISVSIR